MTARYTHHVHHVDLTVVPIGGFWVPWFPLALWIGWPFCWWCGAVVDQYSRSVVATLVKGREPTASDVRAMLDRAVASAGRAPRHIISDRGVQFQSEYLEWCRSHGVKQRYGALGKHGSIAIIERFFRSLKQECFYRLLVPLRIDAMLAELDAYVLWYNTVRPHSAVDGATPTEVLEGVIPAWERPGVEPRARWPLARGDPDVELPRRCGKLELVVTYVEGRKHLPVVELREAA